MTDEAGASANPFPGLRPFRTEEHHLFFGREEQTAALLALLREHRFLAVVGTSGSGKSSLVRAGLIPALHRGTMARAGSTWEVVVLRPGGNPVTSLARALLDAGLYDAADPETLPRLRATLTRSHFGLVEAVRQSGGLDPAANLLVVVDQFEEVFRFREQGTSSEETASAFVSLLLAASEAEERRIYVAITMRSDYLGDCADIPGLAEAVNHGEYLIPRLPRDQRREAIEKPVGVGGARIAPRLVQHMLNDLGDDPDQLPVLQHALMRTWDAWVEDHRDGEPIDLRHYESTGGMAAALSRHADEVFDALPGEGHREAAERIFRALTVKGADNRGIRRPTRLGRLARIAGASEDVVATVVDAYRQPGVTFLMPGMGTQIGHDTVIDLSHESLMRVWKRLSGWVEEEAQSARVYRRLAETADLWKEGRAGLFRDPDLQIALTWRESARPNEAWAEQHGGGLEPAMEFLDRSRDTARADQLAWEEARHRELEQAKALAEAQRRRAEERQRAAKKLKALAAGVAVVAVLALIASVFAVRARRDAVENARLAGEKEELATRAAGDAERAAAALKRTLVESDFHQGAERIDAGEGADGLTYLARALRTDPGFWPAGMRAMSALASGRFPLQTFDVIRHEKVITSYLLNEKEDLLFTSDFSPENDEPKRFVWDTRTGKRLYELASGSKSLFTPAWTKDGKLLFAYDPQQKTIRTWEARSGKEVEPIAAEGVAGIRHGEDPQGRTLYLGMLAGGALQVWRAPGGEAATPRLTRSARSTGGFDFLPDDRRVFGTYADATIAIWEADGGAPVAEISTRPWPIQDGSVFFTPDSETVLWIADAGKQINWRRIASANDAGPWLEFDDAVEVSFLPGGSKAAFSNFRSTRRIDVHDLSSRERTASIQTGRPGPVQGWFVSGEFPFIVTREGNAVRVWDLETGALFREILTPALLSRADLSPEGRRILTATISHEVMLWDIFTGRPLLAEPIEHEGAVNYDFSPEGETLVTHDREKHLVQVWDTRTRSRVTEPREQAHVSSIHFTAGGQRLLLWNSIRTTRGSQFDRQTEGDFRLLDVGLRPVLFEAILHGTGFPFAFWSERGDIVVYGRAGAADPNQVMVWDGASRRPRTSLPLPQGVDGNPDAFALSRDGTRAILGSDDNRARVYDLARGEVLHEIAHASYVSAADLSVDGTRAATGTGQGKVQLWDLATGTPLSEPLDHGSEVITEVRFSPDGSLLASGSVDFKFRLIDGKTGAPRCEPIVTNNIVQGSRFHPDGSHVAVVPFASEVLIVETASGSVIRKLAHVDACRLGRFSPDGRLLAVGTGGYLQFPVGEVQLWDWREGRKVGRPLNAKGAVDQLEFSIDGRLLVTGTVLADRGAVQVWDVATGRPLTEPVAGRAGVASVAFNAAGTEVAAAWQGGVVRVIDLPPQGAPEPTWLPGLAESVARRRLAPEGGGIEEVPREDLERLRGALAGGGTDASGTSGTPHERWARWFFADPEERAASPGSRETLREHLARLRRSPRVEDLQEALRLAPADALTHARLGLVLLDALAAQGELDRDKPTDQRLRRHWEATAAWYGQRAVEMAPRDADARALHAEALDRLGRKAEAAAAAARALELGSSNPNALYLKAVALAGEGKWEEADGAFVKALEGISARAAGGDAAGRRAPLLGVLAALEPAGAPEGFRDLRLPPPIPGTFEDFESAPEGGLPAGWSARHERTDAPRAEAVSGRISNAESDVFEDWVVVSLDRAAANATGQPFYADRLLATDRQERLDGAFPAPLLQGRFLYSLSGDRESSHVQYISTPDLDCSGRKAVHAAFKSAYEQARDTIAAIEYSIDEGRTWLPVLYRLNALHVRLDAAGKVDAAATLGVLNDNAPLFLDEAGEPRGDSYGSVLGAPITRELDPFIEGLRPFDWAAAKRVEILRLPLADGRPKVRLRFLHAGRFGWYWGIDDFGLHEIPGGPVAGTPRIVDRTRDPMVLGGIGLASILGNDLGSAILQPRDLISLTPEEPERPQGTPAAPGTASRRLADGRLLLRRAAVLDPDNPWILLASAFASARAGAPDEAMAAARKALGREPPGRLSAPSHAAVFLSKGDSLTRAGDAAGAAVAYELADVLFRAAAGNADSGILRRLAAAGLAGQSEVLLARGSEWRYLDDGLDPGPEWKDPGFDDTLWPRGKARLGYGNDGEATLVSFGPDPQRKHITTHFRAAFDAGDPGRFAQLKLRVTRDDGVVVYLNGREAFRDNMPEGDVGRETLAPSIVGDLDEGRFFDFEAPASALLPGRNVIAAEVHQQGATSSDLGFDLEIEGLGGLKEVVRAATDLDAIEERLEIPGDLRGVLWASRAGRFRRAGDLERAAEAVERAERLGPGNPSVAYERAHLLQARGDEEAAVAAYRKAVEGAITLKAGARSPHGVFLPDSLKSTVESLVRPSGVGLAGAARRVARVTSAPRETEGRWLLRWSGDVDPEGHAARLERVEALLALGSTEEALATTDAALSSGAASEATATPRRIREEKDWLDLRERCLRRLGRVAEADQVKDEILKPPPRDPKLSPKLIDLSAHYNATLYDGRNWHATENLRMLPETFRPRNGIEFDIRGMIQLNSGIYPRRGDIMSGKDMNGAYEKSYPEAAKAIRVDQRAKALHFLTSGCWSSATAGAEVSRIVIHYEDGGQAECPIRFKEDIVDWALGNEQQLPLDRIAWLGGRPPRRLMRKSWTNPSPEKTIREIDFVSAMTTAAPFLVAVTAE